MRVAFVLLPYCAAENKFHSNFSKIDYIEMQPQSCGVIYTDRRKFVYNRGGFFADRSSVACYVHVLSRSAVYMHLYRTQ
jgi:hypothetical protein